MGDLRDTDLIALSRRFLLASTKATEALGGGGRVGSTNEPPYPRVVLNDPPGDDRSLNHLIAPVLQIEVLGEPGKDGQKPVLRDALYAILQELARLPELQALGEWERLPGEPVVTWVQSTGGGGHVPMPTGQPRYLATLRMHVHP